MRQRWLGVSQCAAAVALVIASGCLAAGQSAPKMWTSSPTIIPTDAKNILEEGSFWRWYVTWRKPVIPVTALKAAGVEASQPKLVQEYGRPVLYMDNSLPPADWIGPDFDDSFWPRTNGKDFPSQLFYQLDTALVCLRGKFACSNPRAVKALYLSARFRGGVVIYLNGQEVARAGMPIGNVTPTTFANPYPDDLFLDEKDRPYRFPGESAAHKRISEGDKDLAHRIQGRDRQLGPVRLPPAVLHKGPNVLAIEVHRSHYHPSALTWSGINRYARWVPCNLLELRLAAVGKGITPSLTHPEGMQVWTMDRNDRVTVADYGDPNEALHPIKLVGARNGVFSGQVVVASDLGIRNLQASASPLKQTQGSYVIPSAKVQLRYPRPDGHTGHYPAWFDGLEDGAPSEVAVLAKWGGTGAVQPIFVTVHVPADAEPGDYRGAVTVLAEGLPPVSVPIHLWVADWTLPGPHELRAHVSLYQSPETLAMKYGVSMWSEAHWKLIEKSMQLLAEVGNNLVQIPLVHHTQFGNEEGWVWWIRKPDGSFDYDFTVFDRYTRLVKKYLVDPEFVCLHVWLSTVYSWGGKHELWKMDLPTYVTLFDPKTGKHGRLTVPAYGTKQSKKFWKPVLLAIKSRLAKVGLDKSICLGVLIENQLPANWTEFHEILPEAGWLKGCHRSTTANEPITMRGGSRIVLQEHAYPIAKADPLSKMPAIWERGRVGVRFFRGHAEQDDLQKFRLSTERNLYYGSRGIGRMCLDYWSVIEGKDARYTHLFNRWPQSSSAQRGPYVFQLAWPGPDGPLPTLRFEAIREGLQEAEAITLVAEAQAKYADKLGKELTAKCRQLFSDRIRYCIPRSLVCPWGSLRTRTNHFGWQELNRRLFQTAAEVTARLAN